MQYVGLLLMPNLRRGFSVAPRVLLDVAQVISQLAGPSLDDTVCRCLIGAPVRALSYPAIIRLRIDNPRE
jgi:hypothetical protein